MKFVCPRHKRRRCWLLDETHPPHVSRKIVNGLRATLKSFFARGSLPQVERQIFYIVKTLVPLIERFLVNCANVPGSIATQRCHEMTTNKTAGATNNYRITFH